jgi:methylenetetrahydrofolate dehydrogenase (NADP+)/methenyltetrahydrofolate cyclohydrolase
MYFWVINQSLISTQYSYTMSQALLGKVIAAQMELELRDAFSQFSKKPTVAIVYVGDNPVIENFVSKKVACAERVGVHLTVYRLPTDSGTQAIVDEVRRYADTHDGVIVQLPLPAGVNADEILDAVPLPKDVDMLSISARNYIAEGHVEVLPAVAGAIREFAERTQISLKGKKIVIIGKGKLVGMPVLAWLRKLHLDPIMVGREATDLKALLHDADVIISGAGQPGLITADMVKEGVVFFDAGTSEVEGKIEGDVSAEANLKASYYTPVPGGIGPLTVACIFKNLLTLMKL